MTIRPGRLILWGVALLVVAAIAWSFRPQPVPVDMAAVQRGSLRVTIDEEGMTRVRERYVVSAPVAGRLQRVELEPGDAVSRRTVLATFFPATPTLLDTRTRAETDARMKAAQAARDQARVAVQRAHDELAFSPQRAGAAAGGREVRRHHRRTAGGGRTGCAHQGGASQGGRAGAAGRRARTCSGARASATGRQPVRGRRAAR